MPLTWTLAQSARPAEPEALSAWAADLQISPLLTNILWNRGLTTPEAMDIFLSPGLRHLPRLEDWPELIQAAEALAEAIQAGRSLAVWGDYDVDGLSATALVVSFCQQRGVKVLSRIPHRLEEGYGLSPDGVEDLARQGAGCLLTVDCGISDHQAVERARQLGLEVVVSDHHLPGADLPPARAVVDPKCSPGCPYPEAAGVGVAFLLMAALNRLLPGERLDIRQLLDLVALGTLADVVELTLPNRILVKNGLLLLGEARRPGIYALKEASRLPPTAVMGSGQVSFGLAPRLNAAGRMGSAQTALDLLLAPDLETARPLAAELERANQDRRSQEADILAEAMVQAEAQAPAPGLVLYHPDWHQGIVGIVASRVVDHFGRPALLLVRDGDRLKGSGRSVAGCDLYAALAGCSDLLLGFGGHPMAAGLSLTEEGLEGLRKRFCEQVSAQLGDAVSEPSLQVEGELGLKAVDLSLVKEVELLQPFGPGNPEPVFSSRTLKVQKHRVFGKNHVSLEVRDPEAQVTMLGKAWRQAHLLGEDIKGQEVRLAFTPRINRYNGLTSIDLQIRDWQF